MCDRVIIFSDFSRDHFKALLLFIRILPNLVHTPLYIVFSDSDLFFNLLNLCTYPTAIRLVFN